MNTIKVELLLLLRSFVLDIATFKTPEETEKRSIFSIPIAQKFV